LLVIYFILSPLLLHFVYDFHVIKHRQYDWLSQRQLHFLLLVFLNEIIRSVIVGEIVWFVGIEP